MYVFLPSCYFLSSRSKYSLLRGSDASMLHLGLVGLWFLSIVLFSKNTVCWNLEIFPSSSLHVMQYKVLVQRLRTAAQTQLNRCLHIQLPKGHRSSFLSSVCLGTLTKLQKLSISTVTSVHPFVWLQDMTMLTLDGFS